jgi:hypothetical protein
VYEDLVGSKQGKKRSRIYESEGKDFFVYSDIHGLVAEEVRQTTKSNFIIVLQILTCTT